MVEIEHLCSDLLGCGRYKCNVGDAFDYHLHILFDIMYPITKNSIKTHVTWAKFYKFQGIDCPYWIFFVHFFFENMHR